MVGCTQVIVFDLDDTLILTQELYDAAKRRFATLMELEGFDGDVAIQELDEIDKENVRLLGFSRQRFPKSMYETYIRLCKSKGQQVKTKIAETVLSIGRSVTDRVPRLMDGAQEVLSQLNEMGYCLYLYTVGDKEIQRRKIANTDLARFFKGIYFVSNGDYRVKLKDEESLRKFLRRYDLNPETTWMVGNSLRSDVNPALALGLPCIWLRTGSWAYDEAELVNGELHYANALSDIPQIVTYINNEIAVA